MLLNMPDDDIFLYLLVTSIHPRLIKARFAEGKFPPREKIFLCRTALSTCDGKNICILVKKNKKKFSVESHNVRIQKNDILFATPELIQSSNAKMNFKRIGAELT